MYIGFCTFSDLFTEWSVGELTWVGYPKYDQIDIENQLRPRKDALVAIMRAASLDMHESQQGRIAAPLTLCPKMCTFSIFFIWRRKFFRETLGLGIQQPIAQKVLRYTKGVKFLEDFWKVLPHF